MLMEHPAHCKGFVIDDKMRSGVDWLRRPEKAESAKLLAAATPTFRLPLAGQPQPSDHRDIVPRSSHNGASLPFILAHQVASR